MSSLSPLELLFRGDNYPAIGGSLQFPILIIYNGLILPSFNDPILLGDGDHLTHTFMNQRIITDVATVCYAID